MTITTPDRGRFRLPGASGRPRRSSPQRIVAGVAGVLAASLLVGTLPASAASPSEVLVRDTFARASDSGWGQADAGHRWMYPMGKGGFSLAQRRGVITQGSSPRPRLATLATKARDVSVAFSFGLVSGSVGPGPKAIAVARKSAGGEYRFGVRIGKGGQVRLSIAKARPGRSAKRLGRVVTIGGWRYRSGDSINVVAQAVKRDPTQLRMKVWRDGTSSPSRWQIIRNDRGADVASGGRVGLMSVPSGSRLALHYDDVTVRRARDAKRAPTGTNGGGGATPPRSETPEDRSPKPTPKPTPSPQKTPAPDSGSNVRTVPTSIDSSGSRNVTSELQKVINSAPNGSTIRFRSGGRYKLGTSLIVSGRRNLTLDGNGARLDIPSTNMGKIQSVGIQVRDGAVGTTIRDFTIVGSNAQAGTSKAFSGRESNHGIAVLNATDTLIEDVEIRRTGSDCLYISRSANGGASEGVTFRDSTCRLSGRHGIGLIAGNDVRIVDNVFDDIGFDVVDIEPNSKAEGANGVVISRNTIGAYALDADWDGWLLAACGPKDGPAIRNVTVANNTIAGNRAGWSGQTKALHLKICGDRGPRSNFVVRNNVAKSTVSGPAMTFRNVKSVTVTGNKQPLSRGTLATFPGSSSVTYDG